MLDSTGARQLSALATLYLGHSVPSCEDLAGRGKLAKTPEELGIEAISDWAAIQAESLLGLALPIRERLETDDLSALFDDVELPLTAVGCRNYKLCFLHRR